MLVYCGLSPVERGIDEAGPLPDAHFCPDRAPDCLVYGRLPWYQRVCSASSITSSSAPSPALSSLVSIAIIPLFFYASGKYRFGLPPEETTWTVLFTLCRPHPLAHGVAEPAEGYGAILNMLGRRALRTPPPRSGGGNASPRPVQELCALLQRSQYRSPRHGPSLRVPA